MTLLSPILVPCRRCGAAMDVARKAALVPSRASNLLVDMACDACGHRALYTGPTAPGP